MPDLDTGDRVSPRERGISNRGLATDEKPDRRSDDPGQNGFDFSNIGIDPTIEWPDILQEAGVATAGSAPRTEQMSLGEAMVRVMESWKAYNPLKYPDRRKGQSGIGPARQVGHKSVLIGGMALEGSNYRSCSPTTFRALMEALDCRLPDGRDMETDKSVWGYYRKWQCTEGADAYPSGSAIAGRKGAVDVIVDARLGNELAVGPGLNVVKPGDLKTGDILQTWSRNQVPLRDEKGRVVRKNGKTEYEPGKESWSGHSALVLRIRDGIWTISATTPAGTDAIKEQNIKAYSAWFSKAGKGQSPSEWGIQAIYIARTTHKVAVRT